MHVQPGTSGWGISTLPRLPGVLTSQERTHPGSLPLGEDSVPGTGLQGLWAAGTFSSCTQTLSTSVCFPPVFPFELVKGPWHSHSRDAGKGLQGPSSC